MSRKQPRTTSNRASYDDAKIHLNVLGQEHEIDCTVRIGRARLSELLTLTRSIESKLTAIAAEHAASQGKTVSCKKGCVACCRHLVPVSPLEAKRLAELVAAMPSEQRKAITRRFDEILSKMEMAGILGPKSGTARSALTSKETDHAAAWNDVSLTYFRLHIDCPFLQDEACSIYEERPMACRQFNAVTDPALCTTLDPNVETLQRPVFMSEVLTDAVNAIAKTRAPAIPLALALEWAHANGKHLSGEYDGESMFWKLLEVMEKSS